MFLPKSRTIHVQTQVGMLSHDRSDRWYDENYKLYGGCPILLFIETAILRETALDIKNPYKDLLNNSHI